MTDETTTPDPTVDAEQPAPETALEPGTVDTADGGEPLEDDTSETGRLRKEAAKWRNQARDVEAERDSLASTVETYRRRDAKQAAEAAGLQSGADLWAGGATLEQLVADDGTVNADAVRAAVETLLVQRPHWARSTWKPGKFSGGARGGRPGSDTTLGEVIRNRTKAR